MKKFGNLQTEDKACTGGNGIYADTYYKTSSLQISPKSHSQNRSLDDDFRGRGVNKVPLTNYNLAALF